MPKYKWKRCRVERLILKILDVCQKMVANWKEDTNESSYWYHTNSALMRKNKKDDMRIKIDYYTSK